LILMSIYVPVYGVDGTLRGPPAEMFVHLLPVYDYVN
jgi:hypothetical protein